MSMTGSHHSDAEETPDGIKTPVLDDDMSGFSSEPEPEPPEPITIDPEWTEEEAFFARLPAVNDTLRDHPNLRLVIAAHSTCDSKVIPETMEDVVSSTTRYDDIPRARTVWLSTVASVSDIDAAAKSSHLSLGKHPGGGRLYNHIRVADGPTTAATDPRTYLKPPSESNLHLPGVTNGDLAAVQTHLAEMAIEGCKNQGLYIPKRDEEDKVNWMPAIGMSGAQCSKHLSQTSQMFVRRAQEYLTSRGHDGEIVDRLVSVDDSLFNLPKDPRKGLRPDGSSGEVNLGNWPPMLPDLCETGDCYRPSVLGRSSHPNAADWASAMSDFASGRLRITPYFEIKKNKDVQDESGWNPDKHYSWRLSKVVPTVAGGSNFDSEYPDGTTTRRLIHRFAKKFGSEFEKNISQKKPRLAYDGKRVYTKALAESIILASERITKWGDDPRFKDSASARQCADLWGPYTGLHVNKPKF